MVGLIRGLRSRDWTAVKITPSGDDVDPRHGEFPEAPLDRPFVLSEETDPRGHGDTCRYLAAGARRALWLRVRQGHFEQAFRALLAALEGDEYVMIESNSVLGFLKPAVYIVVLDGSRRDFKASARQYLEQADALVPIGTSPDASRWPGLRPGSFEHKQVFPLAAGERPSPELCKFVERRLKNRKSETLVPNP